MAMTLLEALGMACIKGDLVAAYALCDKLIEMRENPPDKVAEATEQLRRTSQLNPSSHEVFHWPEFRAFMRRAGINLELLCRDINIDLPMDGVMEVTMNTLAMDTQVRREP